LCSDKATRERSPAAGELRGAGHAPTANPPAPQEWASPRLSRGLRRGPFQPGLKSELKASCCEGAGTPASKLWKGSRGWTRHLD